MTGDAPLPESTLRLSKQIEDYLKNIFKLQQEASPVSTSAIAGRMAISGASATSMIKKLDQMGLLAYTPYKGVVLSRRGEKVALEIIRHHRLIELYLNQKMGIDWDKVDAEAEELEHVLSEELEAVLDKALGYPTLDPHGDPIPAKDGVIIDTKEIVLAALEAGRPTKITRVLQDDPAVLRYLGERGFFPETPIEVIEQSPLAGTVTLLVNGDRHTLGREVASRIFALNE